MRYHVILLLSNSNVKKGLHKMQLDKQMGWDLSDSKIYCSFVSFLIYKRKGMANLMQNVHVLI